MKNINIKLEEAKKQETAFHAAFKKDSNKLLRHSILVASEYRLFKANDLLRREFYEDILKASFGYEFP